MTGRAEKVLTTDDLAEALSCFWNAAIGEAHNRQDSTAFAVASIMAEGFAAIERRLHELSTAPQESKTGMRHPLEAYADSYAQMGRDGDGRVDCRSVEADIRQNMIPITQARVEPRLRP